MKLVISVFLLLVTTCINCFSQTRTIGSVVDYLTYAGTFDKTQNPERAQFAGNNKYLRAYINSNNVFLWSTAGLLNEMNRTAEIGFRVRHDGTVDSLIIIKSSGLFLLDERAKMVITASSGKWRPGTVNDKPVSEFITMWIHVYQGKPKKKDYLKYLEEGNALYASNDFKNAIKAYDAVLDLDELNTQVAAQKGLALMKTGKKEEACRLWQAYKKYETADIQAVLKEYCE